jgi:Holliday junction resolvasome RuvABC endonuclease subunit
MEKTQTILVNDPSITAWGYAVVSLHNKKEIIEVGCIKTSSESKSRRIRKGDDRVRRIQEINDALISLIKKHNVVFMLSELPHGSQNASAAVMIGIVTGIAQTLSACFNIGIEWYSEGDVKKNLLGKRSATKNEVKEEIKKYYDIEWTNVGYKDEAIADAVAIYDLAIKTSPTLQFANKAT